MDELHEEARLILELRRSEIREGMLDGRPWFTTVVMEAAAVLRRRRAWATRTAA